MNLANALALPGTSAADEVPGLLHLILLHCGAFILISGFLLQWPLLTPSPDLAMSLSLPWAYLRPLYLPLPSWVVT